MDSIEVTPLWKRAEEICIERGLVASAYDGSCGDKSRVHMFVMNYQVQASLDVSGIARCL